jgi:hypothetical protein
MSNDATSSKSTQQTDSTPSIIKQQMEQCWNLHDQEIHDEKKAQRNTRLSSTLYIRHTFN